MEVAASHRQILVAEQSQVSSARFAARDAAEAAGFGETDAYRAGIVATELATNLVRHASGGEVLVRCARRVAPGEIEIISIDRGPGVADVSQSLTDGHSTGGTSGTGLGAVRRLSDGFDIYSEPGRGTAVLSRLRADRATSAPRGMHIAGVSVAKSGEEVCGDAWQTASHPDGVLIAVIDGLGHGLFAHEAAVAAIAAIDVRRDGGVAERLQEIHEGLRATRGAAGAVADIRPRQGIVNFAGIGNISGTLFGARGQRHVVSLNGTLGHEARQFREYSYPWEPTDVVVLYSDGLTSHWTLDDRRGLRQHDPALVAAVLYRDFSRQRDDVTVVVGKETA
ncbi:MAG TPA: ATP-binding protein [Vicinamibacterales bacterium]|nr:ATP-binding protein [Vicinamibacterales bacterium]